MFMEKTEPARTKVKSMWNKCRGIKEVEVEEEKVGFED